MYKVGKRSLNANKEKDESNLKLMKNQEVKLFGDRQVWLVSL